jgi:hypothetical protein
MGITLHYELRLPPDTPRTEVARLLAELREYAASRTERVSPLFDLSTDGQPSTDPRVHWLGLCAEWNADPLIDDAPPNSSSDPSSTIGFTVDAGEGCETATFGLMRRGANLTGEADWHWWCSCKTQYASLVSEEHLVAVHTGLVAILDAAVTLGLEVRVTDESGYWESRSTVKLTDSVQKMNRLLARFGGALADALGDKKIEAPIFQHREFEHLEMENPGLS